MTLPNFLFIGTGKAGSTSLYRYLNQHPEVFMSPVKETNFFSYEGGRPYFCGPGDLESAAHHTTITNIQDYENNFKGVTTEKAIGEASPSYLYIPEAPHRIKKYIPQVKMIVILRNPVDRAFSAFAGYTKSGLEPLANFAQAVEEEPKRIQNNWAPSWHYIQNGFYARQLKRYFNVFDRSQFKIYLFEDWKTDPLGMIKDVNNFIGVDDSFIPDMSKKYNQSGRPKSRLVYNFLSRPHPFKDFLKPLVPSGLRKNLSSNLKSLNLEKFPPISTELRLQLTQVYREDIFCLQELLNRDLNHWLQAFSSNCSTLPQLTPKV